METPVDGVCDRILIAVATLGRPRMLAALLQSVGGLASPGSVRIDILIVENSAELSVSSIVDAAAASFSALKFHLINEPRRGIATVRNRALDFALDGTYDWLAFVDDDEEVAPDWLQTLVTAARDRQLDLCGGYCYPKAPDYPLTSRQRGVLSGLSKGAAATHGALRRKVEAGRDRWALIQTSNWMCRLDAVREAGLRFNDALNVSGGEDMRFSEEALEAGLRLGRVPDAITYETVPGSRLSLRYIFRRERDNERTNFYRRFTMRGQHPVARSLVYFTGKSLRGLWLLMASPVLGPKAVTKGVATLGQGLGRLEGTFGARSRHYLAIHGH